jgi:hypothetical protein
MRDGNVQVRDLWEEETPTPKSCPVQKIILKQNTILDTAGFSLPNYMHLQAATLNSRDLGHIA